MSKTAGKQVPDLGPKELFAISEMAREIRGQNDLGMGPLGDNIFKLIRKMGIYLIYLPIAIEPGQDNYFSAMYLSFARKGEKIYFIGLNTCDSYDQQIFSLSHELYHHFQDKELSVCRITTGTSSIEEVQANRFAAEFLLPEKTLSNEIRDVNNGLLDLSAWKHTALLRLIAKLHCAYRLPYKWIVHRLHEIEAIKQHQYSRLLDEPARDKEAPYYLIGMNMDKTIFEMLNKSTGKSGVDGDELDKVLRNFEDGFIAAAELAQDLSLFNKSVADFGLEEDFDIQDLDELNDLFVSSSS